VEYDKRLNFLKIDSLIVRLAYLNQATLLQRLLLPRSLLRDERAPFRACRCVIYASNTTNPVYANIIAAELVWQQARSHVPLNLATSVGDAVVSVVFSSGRSIRAVLNSDLWLSCSASENN